MKVLILGAGVSGITTAYFLASRGHEVEVVDRQNAAGMETSSGSGCQLSFSHAEPWASPAVLPKIAKWMFREDAPLIFRLRLDPWMYVWCLQFLMNCTHAKARYNCSNALRLTIYSKKCLEQICQESRVDFNHQKRGILHIFGNHKDMDAAEKQAGFQEVFGCPYELKNPEECRKLEPALEHTSRNIIGGIHMPIDEVGDAQAFTANLARYCEEKLKVKFSYGAEIEEIEDRAGRISWVRAGGKNYIADKYVLALGSYSSLFARKMGFYIPVYPMKGYSISLDLEGNSIAPISSITDTSSKIVFTRFGNTLRAAGTAEFAGYNNTLIESRLRPMINACKELFPKAGDYDKVRKWSGLRAASPTGTPVLGKTKYDNLYLNTGHGTLGWTMSAGSAKLVADIMEDRKPEILTEGLTLVN